MRAGLTAWAGAMFTLSAALANPLPALPTAPVEVVTDTDYGTTVADPYRWMESGKDPRWMPWLKVLLERKLLIEGVVILAAVLLMRSGIMGIGRRGNKASDGAGHG